MGFIYKDNSIDTAKSADVCYDPGPEAKITNLERPLGVTKDCEYDSSGNPLATTETVANGCHES